MVELATFTKLWAVIIPVALGTYLVVESMTFGRWRMQCWLYGLSRLLDIKHDCGGLSASSEGKSSCLATSRDAKNQWGTLNVLRSNEAFTNSIHFYPGVLLLLVGVLNFVIYLSKENLYEDIMAPTRSLLLVSLPALVLVDILVSETGVSDIIGCIPSVDHEYTVGETVTMIVLVIALIISFYIPLVSSKPTVV